MCCYYTMNRMRLKLIFTSFVVFLGSVHSVVAVAPSERWVERGQSVLEGLNARVCLESRNQPLLDEKHASYGAILARDALNAACENDPMTPSFSPVPPEASLKTAGTVDGDIIARARLMADFGIAVDLVAYASSGLVAAGKLFNSILTLRSLFSAVFCITK